MKKVAIIITLVQISAMATSAQSHRATDTLDSQKRHVDYDRVVTDAEGRRISRFKLLDFTTPCEGKSDMQTREFGESGYMVAFRLIRPIDDPAELARKNGEIFEPATPGTPGATCGLISLDKNGNINGRVKPYSMTKSDSPSLISEDVVLGKEKGDPRIMYMVMDGGFVVAPCKFQPMPGQLHVLTVDPEKTERMIEMVAPKKLIQEKTEIKSDASDDRPMLQSGPE